MNTVLLWLSFFGGGQLYNILLLAKSIMSTMTAAHVLPQFEIIANDDRLPRLIPVSPWQKKVTSSG